jgi:hypothetical protein
MIVGHTGCGMELFTEEELENLMHKRTGLLAVAPSKFHFYTDVNEATKKQILKLRSHPWVPSDVVIRGFVLDLATWKLKEVIPEASLQVKYSRACEPGVPSETSQGYSQVRRDQDHATRRGIRSLHSGYPAHFPGDRV